MIETIIASKIKEIAAKAAKAHGVNSVLITIDYEAGQDVIYYYMTSLIAVQGTRRTKVLEKGTVAEIFEKYAK